MSYFVIPCLLSKLAINDSKNVFDNMYDWTSRWKFHNRAIYTHSSRFCQCRSLGRVSILYPQSTVTFASQLKQSCAAFLM